MPYAIHKRGAEAPPEDGQPVGWHGVGDTDELMPYEAYLQDIPEGLSEPLWDSASQKLRASTQAEILADARSDKEAELRDAADSWYQANVRSFEGAIVTAKYGRSGLTALNTEERAVFDLMSANYTRLKNLIVQARAAATVEALEAIAWTP